MRVGAVLAAALGLSAACGGGGSGGPDAGDPNAEVCPVAAGDGVSFDPAADPCRWLSRYRFFVSTDLATLTANDRVVPYDLNTPLFSDYAWKSRFIYLADGQTMTYDDTDSFSLPEGAVILKTFSYPDDMRQPDGPIRHIETRLLIHRNDGWEGLPYVWNDDQADARLSVAGAQEHISWIHSDGSQRDVDYVVPNKNQCKQCHEEAVDVLGPIGPKARHINRDLDYGAGPENQLTHFADLGMLTGAPADPADAPRDAVFDDDATGTVDQRARAWLDINCAHCHNPGGAARVSGLDLRSAQTTPYDFGICKTPVAAGPGSGGLQYDIVPGDPDHSILVYRIDSTDPAVMMPELGRHVVHEEGVALIRDWIAAMPADPCLAPAPAPATR